MSPAFPSSSTTSSSPVIALKEMVSRLQRENSKIQELLASLSFALRSFNNLNQFFELIPLITCRVTEAEAAALVLFRADGQARLEQLHCHASDQCPNIRAALETATRTLANSVGMAAIDAGSDRPRLEQLLDQQLRERLPQGIQFYATAILVKDSRLTERGRLYVFSQQPDYGWNETRQQLLQVIADQTAVAIANDELALKLRDRQRLDRELEIGAEIQRRLLPHRCPKIHSLELAAECRTASWVGGDYYDFIPITYGLSDQQEIEQGRWGIAIGDVMGKGVPAGLIMTMTRGMLRAEALNGHRPSRILQHLNRAMQPDLESSHRFVTLFYSEYNPQTRILAYSNAAHLPPLLWRAETGMIHRLDTYGMLIGLDPRSQYQEAEVRLQAGDTVIYYTDGITEADNPKGKRFEEEGLAAVVKEGCAKGLGAQALLDYIFDAVDAFTNTKGRRSDDMTLVILRVIDQ
ncbi:MULTISPECIES: PP2C family protein-serine/threonine phosphatase [unclassified Thermosynechococcus]|uniref:PP2C family protein-serine/threonine phosphatase n=1 Tax=unclassified Thermosynechococcus TaxID=2622553 RepID=UPI00059D6C9B|nr:MULTISPECIES: PP2C family protein-serine/threonine phosphatase [unclassified Thermosynechococcus]HIK24062.1 PP2C family protein-serine/threonine phosphatase [Thermosynechococcus sp. M3746_W2019_013]